jgi:hypothetical protein
LERDWSAYLAAPNRCLQCGEPILPHKGEKLSETVRRRFCTRSCAASHNNSSAVAPKKKARPRFCVECGVRVATTAPEGSRILCASCTDTLLHRLPNLTPGEASAADLRLHIRQVMADRPRMCAQCGYAVHVETVHLRPAEDFLPGTPLAEINAPTNLVYLCPNHRWEYEHGLISLDATSSLTAYLSPASHPRRPARRPQYVPAAASR